MTSTFSALDYAIFIGYAILILGVGLWVSRDKKGHQKNAEDYFLASKSLAVVGSWSILDRGQHLCRAVHRHVGFGLSRLAWPLPPMSGWLP